MLPFESVAMWWPGPRMPGGWIEPTTFARKRGLGSDQLLHELAVAGEHLHAPVLAIREIDHSVVGDADGMRNIEMRGSLGVRKGLWRHDCAAVLAALTIC